MKNINNSNFAVLYKLRRPLVIEKLNLPKLKKNQLLIKIKYSFICGTQLNEIFGLKGKDKYLPHVLGHEASGNVVGIGPNVKKFRIGEKVFLSWIKKKEPGSANPHYSNKKNQIVNSGLVSTFSNFTIVSKDRVYKIPSKIPMDLAALFGCALPTGFGIVFKFLKKISVNDYVGVYGVGGVGLMALIALRATGVRNIYAVDKNKKNLLFANKLGCKFVGSLDEINKIIARQKIRRNNIKYNFEMSGNAKLIEHALNNLSNKGKMIFAGNPQKGSKIKINPYDLIFGKNIYGFSGNDVSLEDNLQKYKKIINKIGYKKIQSIFSTYKFKDINLAIRDFKNGSVIRPLIKF